MLINIRKSEINEVTKVDKGSVKIIYDQKPVVVNPGETLDVRDFGVMNENILGVERHLLRKNPGVFSQQKTEDVYKTAKAALAKIKELEAEVEKLKEEVSTAKKAGSGSSDAEAKVKAENEGLEAENKSLKKQVGELKARVKSLR